MKLTEQQKQLAKEYGSYIVNTGGNDIVELAERPGVTVFNNAVVALMQASVTSQLALLQLLKNDGKLVDNGKGKT